MIKLGLVTVLYKSDDVLDGFFRSLSEQTFSNYILILIDNSPSEKTDKLIAQLSQKYHLTNYLHVANDGNFGVAKGNNQGIELSLKNNTTHTLILNNDIEFDQPFLLQQMCNKALSDNETLIVPKILFYDTRKIWMAGGYIKPHKGIIKHVGEGCESDDPKYNKSGYFNYAPTCFMLVRNSIFKQIGLMDEKYFVYYDDTDFIYRATEADNKICYMPNLVVLHKVSSSTGGGESPFSIYYSNRNRLYFVRKNLKGLKFLSALTFTLATRGIKLMNASSQEKKNLYKAIVDGLKMDYR